MQGDVESTIPRTVYPDGDDIGMLVGEMLRQIGSALADVAHACSMLTVRAYYEFRDAPRRVIVTADVEVQLAAGLSSLDIAVAQALLGNVEQGIRGRLAHYGRVPQRGCINLVAAGSSVVSLSLVGKYHHASLGSRYAEY